MAGQKGRLLGMTGLLLCFIQQMIALYYYNRGWTLLGSRLDRSRRHCCVHTHTHSLKKGNTLVSGHISPAAAANKLA